MSKGGGNGFCAIGNAEKINALPFPDRFRTLRYSMEDCFAIFLARVLISNNEKIGHLCRNTPHNRTFLYISFTGRAKHNHEFAWREWSHNREYLFQAIRSVSIIYNDSKWLPFVNSLHPPCD